METNSENYDDTNTDPVLGKLQIREQLQLLDQRIMALLPQSSQVDPDPHNILPLIEYRLSQFPLLRDCEVLDLSHRAYIRLRNKVELGEVCISKIVNFPAYFKRYIFNILREEHRHKKRGVATQKKLNGEFLHEEKLEECTSYLEKGANQEIYERLKESLEDLNDKEYRLLILHIVQGLSWPEIANHFIELGQEKGEHKRIVNRLKQRGYRALKKLRCSFDSTQSIA